MTSRPASPFAVCILYRRGPLGSQQGFIQASQRCPTPLPATRPAAVLKSRLCPQAGGGGEAEVWRRPAAERGRVHGHHLPGLHPDVCPQAERGGPGGGAGHRLRELLSWKTTVALSSWFEELAGCIQETRPTRLEKVNKAPSFV